MRREKGCHLWGCGERDAVPYLCLSPGQVTVSQDGRRARSRRGERRLETAARGRGEQRLGMIESLPPLRRTQNPPLVSSWPSIVTADGSQYGEGYPWYPVRCCTYWRHTGIRCIEDRILNKVQLDFWFLNNWEDIYIYLSFIFVFLPCIERIRSVFVQLMTR